MLIGITAIQIAWSIGVRSAIKSLGLRYPTRCLVASTVTHVAFGALTLASFVLYFGSFLSRAASGHVESGLPAFLDE